MKRNKKEETSPNLIQWLHEEASLRMGCKLDFGSSFDKRSRQQGSLKRRTTEFSRRVLGLELLNHPVIGWLFPHQLFTKLNTTKFLY